MNSQNVTGTYYKLDTAHCYLLLSEIQFHITLTRFTLCATHTACEGSIDFPDIFANDTVPHTHYCKPNPSMPLYNSGIDYHHFNFDEIDLGENRPKFKPPLNSHAHSPFSSLYFLSSSLYFHPGSSRWIVPIILHSRGRSKV